MKTLLLKPIIINLPVLFLVDCVISTWSQYPCHFDLHTLTQYHSGNFIHYYINGSGDLSSFEANKCTVLQWQINAEFCNGKLLEMHGIALAN